MDFDHSAGIIQNVNSAEGLLVIGGTGALQVPTGTTAQRPVSAGTGSLRINSTSGSLEVFNNSAWVNVGLGDVSSVALALPNIFSVVGSPITSAGTITASLVSQPASTVLAAPLGSAGTPGFRQLSLNDLSDVVTTGAASTNVLTFNGTGWVPSAVATGSASGILNSWTLVSGSNPARYTASFSHNLGTFAVVVSLFDTTTNQMVLPDSLQLTNGNTVAVTVSSDTRSLRIVVVANGMAIAAGGSTPSSVTVQDDGAVLGTATAINFAGAGISSSSFSSGLATINFPAAVANAGGSPSLQQGPLAGRPASGFAGRLYLATDTNVLFRDIGTAWVALTSNAIRTLSFVAASMDTPNSADWIISSIAPAISDPSYNSLVVRSFDQTTEQGAGMLITVPANATSCTITVRGRPQTTQASTTVVQMRVYRRQFASGSAPGAWGAAVDLANIFVPTNSNIIYSSQKLSLSALGWTAGQMTLLEFTRRTSGITGGPNLPAAFLVAEIQLEFN